VPPLYLVLLQCYFPAYFQTPIQHGGKVAIYFEAAAMVTVLVLLGQVPELRARSRTSAGLTLVSGDLLGIARAIRLSRVTMWNIRQNLIFAFLFNALGIPLAAGVLYPFFGLLLSPIITGAAMSLSSVSVISNALRLRNVKLGSL